MVSHSRIMALLKSLNTRSMALGILFAKPMLFFSYILNIFPLNLKLSIIDLVSNIFALSSVFNLGPSLKKNKFLILFLF